MVDALSAHTFMDFVLGGVWWSYKMGLVFLRR